MCSSPLSRFVSPRSLFEREAISCMCNIDFKKTCFSTFFGLPAPVFQTSAQEGRVASSILVSANPYSRSLRYLDGEAAPQWAWIYSGSHDYDLRWATERFTTVKLIKAIKNPCPLAAGALGNSLRRTASPPSPRGEVACGFGISRSCVDVFLFAEFGQRMDISLPIKMTLDWASGT